jgi:hypothetical protein
VEYTHPEDGTWSFKLTFEDDPVPIVNASNFLSKEQVNYEVQAASLSYRRGLVPFVQRICITSDIRGARSSKRTEHRDLQELQSRNEGPQRAHLPQEAKWRCPKCKRVRMQATSTVSGCEIQLAHTRSR